MKLKIKVKNIIILTLITLFVILIVVPFTTLEIAKYLDKKGSDRAYIFYESYLSKAIKPSESEALYKYASNMIGDFEPYYLMTNFGGSLSQETSNMETIEKGMTYLEDILSTTNGSLNEEVYKKLLDASLTIMNKDKLMEWIAWGKDKNLEIKYISDIYESYYYFTNEEYKKANNILNNYETKDVDYMYYLIKAYIAEFTGDIELANKYYDENVGGVGEDFIFGRRMYYDRKSWLNNYEEKIKGINRIRGKVTYNGKPMPFVEVFANDSLNTFRPSALHFVGVTDINGEYDTIGLRSGKYNFGIAINNSILFNKVFKKKADNILELEGDMIYNFEFTDPIKVITPKNGELVMEDEFIVEWEDVPGSEYYMVELTKFYDKSKTGYSRHAIPDENKSYNIFDTKAKFDLNYLKNFSASTSLGGEDMIISPFSILSSFLPGSESLISVIAYDKLGNELGNSMTMNLLYEDLPTIKIPGELSQGEKIILSGEHEKAIIYYENILLKEPENLEALKYLIKYNIMGWKLELINFDKAFVYANDYFKITQDDFFILETIGYMDYPTLLKYEDLIKSILSKIPESKRDINYYQNMARIYRAKGDFKNARSYYEKIEEDFIDTDILEIDLYLGDINKALARLKSDDFNTRLMNKKILIEHISTFDENVLNSKDYKELRLLLENVLNRKMDYKEIENLFFEIYPKITNPHIKGFLDQYKVGKYWDMGNEW